MGGIMRSRSLARSPCSTPAVTPCTTTALRELSLSAPEGSLRSADGKRRSILPRLLPVSLLPHQQPPLLHSNTHGTRSGAGPKAEELREQNTTITRDLQIEKECRGRGTWTNTSTDERRTPPYKRSLIAPESRPDNSPG